MHCVDYLVVCFFDLNGYVDRHIDGFHGVHGEYDVGDGNFERKMLQVFCM